MITKQSYHYEVSKRISERNFKLPCIVRVPRERLINDYWKETHAFWNILYFASSSPDHITIVDVDSKVEVFPIQTKKSFRSSLFS